MLPKAGQIVHCTRCQQPLLRFVRDVTQEDMGMDRSLYEPIGEQTIGNSYDKAECSYCGADINPRNYR